MADDNKENSRFPAVSLSSYKENIYHGQRDGTREVKTKRRVSDTLKHQSLTPKKLCVPSNPQEKVPEVQTSTPYKYITRCVGKVPCVQTQTTSTNTLHKTLSYLQQERHFDQLPYNQTLTETDSSSFTMSEKAFPASEKSAELSSYSDTTIETSFQKHLKSLNVARQNLKGNYYSSDLRKTVDNFTNSKTGKYLNAKAKATHEHSKMQRYSLKQGYQGLISTPVDAITKTHGQLSNQSNGRVKNRSQNGSDKLITTNHSSCDNHGDKTLTNLSKNLKPAERIPRGYKRVISNTSNEHNESPENRTHEALSMSFISAAADVTTLRYEQPSTLDLAEGDVQLHSTFSYPLHSTFRDMDDTGFLILKDDGDTSHKVQIVSPELKSDKSFESTIGLNKAKMSGYVSPPVQPVTLNDNLSVTNVIRNTVEQTIEGLGCKTSMDTNNNTDNATVSMDTSSQNRLPGDGYEYNYDSDNSNDSSTLSFCVDEESFEGDAFSSASKRPPIEGNCDVCKIMKRQKATVDLNSNQSNNDSDNGDNTAVKTSSGKSLSPLCHTPIQTQIKYTIQEAKAVLCRSDPKHYSPGKWVGSEVTREHYAKYRSGQKSVSATPNNWVGSDNRSQNTQTKSKARSRLNFEGDGSQNPENLASSVSTDSGNGSSYQSESVSMDTSKPNKPEVWHSTPWNGNVMKKSAITYKMVENNVPFPVYEDLAPHTPTIKPQSHEKGLQDSTGKYLNTPVKSQSRACKTEKKTSSDSSENSSYDTNAIKKKLKRFCKNFQQENVMDGLQTFGQV